MTLAVVECCSAHQPCANEMGASKTRRHFASAVSYTLIRRADRRAAFAHLRERL